MVIHIWTLLKSILKNYHLHGGCCCSRKRQQVLAEKIKLFLHSLAKGWQRSKSEYVKIVDRSYLEKNFKAQSETAQKFD